MADSSNDVVVAGRFKWSDLFKKEDWLSIWGAFLIITLAAVGVLTGAFDFSAAKFDTWGSNSEAVESAVKTTGHAERMYADATNVFAAAQAELAKPAAEAGAAATNALYRSKIAAAKLSAYAAAATNNAHKLQKRLDAQAPVAQKNLADAERVLAQAQAHAKAVDTALAATPLLNDAARSDFGEKAKKEAKSLKTPGAVSSFAGVFTEKLGFKVLLTFLALAFVFTIGNKLEGKKALKFLVAFTAFFALVCVVRLLSAQFTFNRYLEYAFWALLLGLVISNTVKTPEWLKPALRTEFYIKTGLVILGAQVLFSNIQKFGLYGLGIAWGVTPIVIVFMWWLGVKVLKIQNKPLVITIAAATSVCGTSAAIAAAAAAKAKKTDLAFAVGTSLIFTVLMMVGMPFFIKLVHIDPMVGGAWIGGTVDSTGAVVLAGQALGDVGGQVAALVKMIQNILIGFVALGIAVFFTTKVDRSAAAGEKVGVGEIWQRFPKFILGFIAASMIFSFVMQPTFGVEETNKVIKALKEYQNWAFALAFTSIGLETNFKELCGQVQGGKPFQLYIVGQVFNLILTFAIAWLLLSGKIFPVPAIAS